MTVESNPEILNGLISIKEALDSLNDSTFQTSDHLQKKLMDRIDSISQIILRNQELIIKNIDQQTDIDKFLNLTFQYRTIFWHLINNPQKRLLSIHSSRFDELESQTPRIISAENAVRCASTSNFSATVSQKTASTQTSKTRTLELKSDEKLKELIESQIEIIKNENEKNKTILFQEQRKGKKHVSFTVLRENTPSIRLSLERGNKIIIELLEEYKKEVDALVRMQRKKSGTQSAKYFDQSLPDLAEALSKAKNKNESPLPKIDEPSPPSIPMLSARAPTPPAPDQSFGFRPISATLPIVSPSHSPQEPITTGESSQNGNTIRFPEISAHAVRILRQANESIGTLENNTSDFSHFSQFSPIPWPPLQTANAPSFPLPLVPPDVHPSSEDLVTPPPEPPAFIDQPTTPTSPQSNQQSLSLLMQFYQKPLRYLPESGFMNPMDIVNIDESDSQPATNERSPSSSSSSSTSTSNVEMSSGKRKKRPSRFIDSPESTKQNSKRYKAEAPTSTANQLDPMFTYNEPQHTQNGSSIEIEPFIHSVEVEVDGEIVKKRIYQSEPDHSKFQELFKQHKRIDWKTHFKKTHSKSVNQSLKEKFIKFKETDPKQRDSRFRIQNKEIIGNTLFRLDPIPKGTIIDEYSGEFYYAPMKFSEESDSESEDVVQNPYIFGFTDCIDKKMSDFVVDAQVICNKSVFIAHNKKKYANVEPHIYFDEEGPHIIFVASRAILAGEAITFDYGKSYWEKLRMKPVEKPSLLP